ncbi:MAG: Rrf2 family transcriptional regulator, partial [Coriobacteriales bacterium]
GLALARPAEQITVLDIVEATHGDTSISVCTRDPGWCERAGSCSVHRIWKEADALVRQHLRSKTLAGLVTE